LRHRLLRIHDEERDFDETQSLNMAETFKLPFGEFLLFAKDTDTDGPCKRFRQLDVPVLAVLAFTGLCPLANRQG
jgi:hypothetical protein